MPPAARERVELALALKLTQHSWSEVTARAGFNDRTAARRAVQREIGRRERTAADDLETARALRRRIFGRGGEA